MTHESTLPGQTSYIVIRAPIDLDHPHLNVWLLRGELTADVAGNLRLEPNLPHTFEGLAQATAVVEGRPDGQSAQVYRLVSAGLHTPRRWHGR